MKTSNVISSIVLAVSVFALAACAKTSGKDSNVGGESPSSADSNSEEQLTPASAWAPTANQCTDESGEHLACVSNDECCKGFSCGFDPERSRVQRYCLPE